MIDAIYKYFDSDPYKIVHWAMENRQWPNEYFIICNIVLNHLSKNDPHSKILLKKTASEVDKIYLQLQQKTKLEYLPCYLYGYIAPYVEPFLSENIKKNITHPNGNGLSGAIKMIRAATHEAKNSTI
jgi:N-acetylglucosamine kinase-like BadF-type ATPase